MNTIGQTQPSNTDVGINSVVEQTYDTLCELRSRLCSISQTLRMSPEREATDHPAPADLAAKAQLNASIANECLHEVEEITNKL